MKRLAFAAAAVAFIAWCVVDAYQFIWEEEDANAAKAIASIRQTDKSTLLHTILAHSVASPYEPINESRWQR
jgi:hypothetical protein